MRSMAGIVSYGSYVPYRRLKRAAISQVLGVPAGKGERAVASFDEDSVSMAVEAVRDAMRGAAAPAFVFGSENVLAEIEATASITREYLDSWRAPGERFGHSWEERFSMTQAYVPILSRAIQTVLTKAKIGPADLTAVVLDTPNP